VDAHGMPVRMLVTEGTTADCAQAAKLIEGIDAENLIAVVIMLMLLSLKPCY